MPGFQAAADAWGDKGVGFLALSLEPDVDQVRSTAERLGLRVTVATTRDEVLAPLGARGVPATILVDSNGRVVGAATGARDQAFFEQVAGELAARVTAR